MEVKQLLKQLEKEGEQKVQNIKIENQPFKPNTFFDIIRDGAAKFEQETGKKMTYSEMRQAYG